MITMEVFCKLASGDDQSKGIVSPQFTGYIFPTIFFTVVFKGQGQLTCKCNITTHILHSSKMPIFIGCKVSLWCDSEYKLVYPS